MRQKKVLGSQSSMLCSCSWFNNIMSAFRKSYQDYQAFLIFFVMSVSLSQFSNNSNWIDNHKLSFQVSKTPPKIVGWLRLLLTALMTTVISVWYLIQSRLISNTVFLFKMYHFHQFNCQTVHFCIKCNIKLRCQKTKFPKLKSDRWPLDSTEWATGLLSKQFSTALSKQSANIAINFSILPIKEFLG